MKSFLILFSLFIVISVCESVKDPSRYEIQKKIMRLLHRLPQSVLMVIGNSFQISSNGSEFDPKCHNRSESFKKDLESAIECFNATDRSLTICTVIKTRLITCIKPVINLIEDCVLEKLKGVPTLLAKSFVSSVSYLCGITGEQMFEFFNDCTTQQWNNVKDSNITKEIQGKLKKIKDNVSVKNICSTGPEIKNLIGDSLGKVCPNQMTQIVYIGLIDAILKPCTVDTTKQELELMVE